MFTRRNALKLGSAIAAGRIAVPADTKASTIFQPGKFASDLSGYLSFEMTHTLAEVGGDDFIVPELRAEFDGAYYELMRLMPELRNTPNDHPFTRMVETYVASVNAAYEQGARHGAQIEALRRELVGETAQCPACWGWGVVAAGDGRQPTRGEAAHACGECGGSGTIPAARVDAAKRKHRG